MTKATSPKLVKITSNLHDFDKNSDLFIFDKTIIKLFQNSKNLHKALRSFTTIL